MNLSKQNNLHVFSAGAVAPPIKKFAEEFKAKVGTGSVNLVSEP